MRHSNFAVRWMPFGSEPKRLKIVFSNWKILMGPLDKEAIQKLKDEKKKLANDHKEKPKQLDALAKAVKEAQTLQQDINKTRLSKGKTERRIGQLKGQKDALQPLDELKQKARGA